MNDPKQLAKSTPHYDAEWLRKQPDSAIESMLMSAHLSPGWTKPGQPMSDQMRELMAEKDRRTGAKKRRL